jgi:hypothetical protein
MSTDEPLNRVADMIIPGYALISELGQTADKNHCYPLLIFCTIDFFQTTQKQLYAIPFLQGRLTFANK